MEFARKQIKSGRAAYLMTFRESLKETVLNINVSDWRIDLLKENYKDALLIVDNFDSEIKTLVELQREPAYKELSAWDMKNFFTTSSRPNDSVPELEPFNEENIFRKLIREIN